jgi:hypothetical protein
VKSLTQTVRNDTDLRGGRQDTGIVLALVLVVIRFRAARPGLRGQ